jgi:RNA-binding motif X-linked protein 2
MSTTSSSFLNESELQQHIPDEASWHQTYRDTSWIFVGGLSKELTEGDVLCVFSQFGEIEDIIMPRDGETGSTKGYAFIKYEDWRSAVLTIDNFDGVQLLQQRLRLNHTKPKIPLHPKKTDGMTIQEKLALVEKRNLVDDHIPSTVTDDVTNNNNNQEVYSLVLEDDDHDIKKQHKKKKRKHEDKYDERNDNSSKKKKKHKKESSSSSSAIASNVSPNDDHEKKKKKKKN